MACVSQERIGIVAYLVRGKDVVDSVQVSQDQHLPERDDNHLVLFR